MVVKLSDPVTYVNRSEVQWRLDHRANGIEASRHNHIQRKTASMSPLPRTTVAMLVFAAPFALLPTGGSAQQSPPTTFQYPAARRGDQVDDYFGTKVADPYRWLEDVDSPEARAWIEAENALTFDYLGRIPQREAIRHRLTALWNYARYGTPFKKRGQY